MNTLSKDKMSVYAHISQTSPSHRTLLGLLGHMLVRMDRGRMGGSSSDPADPKGDRWDDDAYVYIEAQLPSGLDIEADISVHDGRVFIRMEK
jgi:hypothetical protein